MSIKLPEIKINKRESQSLSRSRPLEHIFHNPILKDAKKKELPISESATYPSYKVLELKLPLLAVPKIFNNCLFNTRKAISWKKSKIRTKSVDSDLYIEAINNFSNKFSP